MSRKTYIVVILAALTVIGIGCCLIAKFWTGFAAPKKTGRKTVAADTLDPDVRSALDGLDTDYLKIRWGCEYAISEDFPGIVVSVAPYDPDPYHYLAVAVTNVESQEVIFSGDMQIKAADDSVIGSGFFFKDRIAPGQTVIRSVDCGTDKNPDGRIGWTNVEMIRRENHSQEPWTAEWSIVKEPDFNRARADVRLSGSLDAGDISALLLDKEGNILSGAREFVHDEPLIGPVRESLLFYLKGPAQENIADMAVFCGTR